MGATTTNKKPHAVFVPFPAQGHIMPMMKLAKIFHCKGFHVTFVNTKYNHRRLVRSRGPHAVAGLPDFRFATIPDGLPLSNADGTQDIPSLCHSIMTTCLLPHLRNLLHDLNSVAGVPPVSFVVSDGVMSFSMDAAVELGVPCVLFWTASVCGFMGYRNFQFLLDEGLTPLKDEEQVKNGYLDTPVTAARGMSKHMRLREVVEARIREVMGGEGVGREMRRKAAEWSEIAVRATTKPGGRSLANLESMFKDVLTTTKIVG